MMTSNVRLSLQDFKTPNTQIDMFPSQDDNSNVAEMVEMNTEGTNVVDDNTDSLRDHQMEFMQEELEQVMKM